MLANMGSPIAEKSYFEANHTQKCKPDYERIIERCKKERDRHRAFKEAIFNFIQYNSVSGPLAELIGELVVTERRYDAEINDAIAAQEAGAEAGPDRQKP